MLSQVDHEDADRVILHAVETAEKAFVHAVEDEVDSIFHGAHDDENIVMATKKTNMMNTRGGGGYV